MFETTTQLCLRQPLTFLSGLCSWKTVFWIFFQPVTGCNSNNKNLCRIMTKQSVEVYSESTPNGTSPKKYPSSIIPFTWHPLTAVPKTNYTTHICSTGPPCRLCITWLKSIAMMSLFVVIWFYFLLGTFSWKWYKNSQPRSLIKVQSHRGQLWNHTNQPGTNAFLTVPLWNMVNREIQHAPPILYDELKAVSKCWIMHKLAT